MKRIISFSLVMLLVMALAVPAFAEEYNGNSLPNVYSLGLGTELYYFITTNGTSGGVPNFGLYVFDKPITTRKAGDPTVITIPANTTFWIATARQGATEWSSASKYTTEATSVNRGGFGFVWANFDIYDPDGNLVLDGEEYIPPMCDGSACPATDANHDNICDDCGVVLAYSLRSDLLQYAYVHLQNGQGLYSSDDFWLITENDEGGYYIYLSNEPFIYGMSTAILSSDGTIHSSSVRVMSTGQNGGTGWTTKTPGTGLPYGNPVASSHDIEGFFPGALWEEMEAVTQGAIVAEQIRLNRTVGILVTTGVGLVALLVLFRILAKKSLIYRA